MYVLLHVFARIFEGYTFKVMCHFGPDKLENLLFVSKIFIFFISFNLQYMIYGYGPQEMGTAQNLVVRVGRRADPPIYDAYADDSAKLKLFTQGT